MVIGVAIQNVENKVLQGSWDCHTEQHSMWWGAVIPLIYFVPDKPWMNEYCDARKEGKK